MNGANKSHVPRVILTRAVVTVTYIYAVPVGTRVGISDRVTVYEIELCDSLSKTSWAHF